MIDFVLPVHNEAECISHVLTEFHEEVAGERGIPIRFVVCEDGSTDDSVEVIRSAAEKLPIHLITSPERKGYSRAVIDGLEATTSEIVGFIDSDGQCSPKDIERFMEHIDRFDLVIGYRNPRKDHWIRILMSRSFGAVYRIFFDVHLRDPSCPYFLIHRGSLERILEGDVGVLKQGFWWEFFARAISSGLRIHEVPVSHRDRFAGTTAVYRPTKVPRIAFEHLLGLFALRRELTDQRNAK